MALSRISLSHDIALKDKQADIEEVISFTKLIAAKQRPNFKH